MGRDLEAVERQMCHVIEACRAALLPLSRLLPSARADDLLLKLQGRAAVIMEALREPGTGPAAGFEEMSGDIEGWSEWRNPLPGYKIACCDCGLVHEMEFKIVSPGRLEADGSTTAPVVDGLSVVFRARRFHDEH